MTSDQIALVRVTWPRVLDNADALTMRFYAHLFEIDASASRLFSGVDMVAQRAKLSQSLAVMVSVLDDADRLYPALAALGKRHTHYGVQERHFASVGEALIRALEDTLGAAFTPALRAAWTAAYAVVAAVMQRALVRASLPVAR